MSLRNVGSGVAVLQAWGIDVPPSIEEQAPLDDLDRLRRQLRDLYISANDVGFWQAALRDADDPLYEGIRSAIQERRTFLIDVMYTNDEGDQRALTRFVVAPTHDDGTQPAVLGRTPHLSRPAEPALELEHAGDPGTVEGGRQLPASRQPEVQLP